MKSIGRRENQAWNGGGVWCGSKRRCGRGRTDTSPWCHALLWHTLYSVDAGVTRRSRRRHDVGKMLHINDLHVNVHRRRDRGLCCRQHAIERRCVHLSRTGAWPLAWPRARQTSDIISSMVQLVRAQLAVYTHWRGASHWTAPRATRHTPAKMSSKPAHQAAVTRSPITAQPSSACFITQRQYSPSATLQHKRMNAP